MAEKVSSKTDLWKLQSEFNEKMNSDLNEIQEMMNSMMDTIRGLNKSTSSQNFQSSSSSIAAARKCAIPPLEAGIRVTDGAGPSSPLKMDTPGVEESIISLEELTRQIREDKVFEEMFLPNPIDTAENQGAEDGKFQLQLKTNQQQWNTLDPWSESENENGNGNKHLTVEEYEQNEGNNDNEGDVLSFGEMLSVLVLENEATVNGSAMGSLMAWVKGVIPSMEVVWDQNVWRNDTHKVFDEITDLVPTARHSFSSVSLIRNERNDVSILNRADYCKFDEVLGPFSVKHNTRIDIQEVLEPPTFDLLKILGCDFINSNGLKQDFDKMASNLNVDFGVDGILMFVFDPGGNSSLQMDLFIDRDVCGAVLGRPCAISSLLVILQWKSILNAAMDACKALKQDGLVVIGGVASNTAAAQLAETLAEAKCPTKVVGVPVTLNGDRKNQFVEANVGFDAICKVNSQLTRNVYTDAFSVKRYYYFIRFMGRRASHVALECTLQSHPNMLILGEELAGSKLTLFDIITQICNAVKDRATQDKGHGIILLPEGLIESISEVYALLQEIHGLLRQGISEDNISSQLSPWASALFEFLPPFIRKQLLLYPESDDSAQPSQIETVKFLSLVLNQDFGGQKSSFKLGFQQHLSSNSYDGITIAEFQNFVWDPGQCAIFVYILGDKDVFERVGKMIISMDITWVIMEGIKNVQNNCIIRRWCERAGYLNFNDGYRPQRKHYSEGLAEYYLGVIAAESLVYDTTRTATKLVGQLLTADVGTNNEELLKDEVYIRLRRRRATRPEYAELLHEILSNIKQMYGEKVLIEFEDFAVHNAFKRTFSKEVLEIMASLEFDVVGLFWIMLCNGPRVEELRGSFASHYYDDLEVIMSLTDIMLSIVGSSTDIMLSIVGSSSEAYKMFEIDKGNQTALAELASQLQMVPIDISRDIEEALKFNGVTMESFVWDPGFLVAPNINLSVCDEDNDTGIKMLVVAIVTGISTSAVNLGKTLCGILL